MHDTGLDTIAAIATGSGVAGIGVIRVSGPDVERIALAVTGVELVVRQAHYLPFLDEHLVPIDEGIAIRFESPNSFTGEDVLELQGHGGPVILDMMLGRVLQLGARTARPGEFSERAFHNDKLDLAQAEAISDLIESSSVAAARASVRSMRGEFSQAVASITDELIAIRVWLEAALDFSEEDIDFLAQPELKERAVRLVQDFDLLLARAEQGQRLRDGLNIVIAGATNAGKSSLLNRLSGVDTAIVTDIAGTTRDVLKTDISIEGVPLHVIDTAGIRQTDDVVENLGIERAYKAVEEADHVLVLLDATAPAIPELPMLADTKTTYIINKIDLVDNASVENLVKQYDADITLSAKTQCGMDKLKQYLLKLSGYDERIEGVYIARRRHIHAIECARQSSDEALARLKDNTMPELAAEEFRLAQQSLEAITGRFDSEDLLGEIFSSFCIGK